MSSVENNATYAVQTVVRGQHVYKEAWSTLVGQVLSCQKERGNVHDPYSVAIVDRNTVVGHVPGTILAVCSLFQRRNGVITCKVTLCTSGIPLLTCSPGPPAQIFTNKTIAKGSNSTKFTEHFTLESFWLYGICSLSPFPKFEAQWSHVFVHELGDVLRQTATDTSS